MNQMLKFLYKLMLDGGKITKHTQKGDIHIIDVSTPYYLLALRSSFNIVLGPDKEVEEYYDKL